LKSGLFLADIDAGIYIGWIKNENQERGRGITTGFRGRGITNTESRAMMIETVADGMSKLLSREFSVAILQIPSNRIATWITRMT